MQGPGRPVGNPPHARPTPRKDGHGAGRTVDLVLGALATIVAAGAVALTPDGDPVRILLTAPILFLVPGYLFLQMFYSPAAPWSTRAWHALASLGVSPALVALLALSTGIVKGGFRAGPMVAVTTLACLAFAVVAGYRRFHTPTRSKDEAPHQEPSSPA